ncbi:MULTISPECIES: winged helix-turn-helix transcriptional regulator [Nostocales]|uniref:Response regulator n=3 Tax=Nostocales TaxID=1161 RepID=A0A8S9TAF2_9CYAN|nr:response regulator [Tolypothrix bouteillei VB521301]
MPKTEYNCPVEVTLEVIGGKWKCVILWWLRRDAKRFGELKQLIPGITQKVLTGQLRELERDGLICREAYREVPPRVEYSLTSYGESLGPITELMCAWGKTHKPEYEFGYLRLQGLHVLIVSSETAVRDLLQRMIEERAARVIAVGNITAALTAVEQMQLDALIVDIRGLGEESYRLIQQIKSVEAVQRRQIPAIALTRSDADRGRAIHEGYAVHIAEPFEPVELVAILASLTSRPD